MNIFNYEKDHFSEKTFSNIEKKPLKFKYVNFRDFLSLIITGGTNQLTEVQYKF